MVFPTLLSRKHEIDEEIGTPVRNHIKFPGVEDQKSTFGKKKTSIVEKKQQTSDVLGERKKIYSKTRVLPLEESQQGRTTSAASKQSKKSFSALKVGGKKNTGKLSSGSSIPQKVKVNDASTKELKSPRAEGNKPSLGDMLYEHVWPGEARSDGELNKAGIVKPATKRLSSEPPLDADRKRRSLSFPLLFTSFKSNVDFLAAIYYLIRVNREL